MNKRGIGRVTAIISIVLISIVLVSVFLGAYFKSVKKSTSDDSALCLGIDLEPKTCYIYDQILNYYLNQIPNNNINIALNEYVALINVERHPGKGYIKGMKVITEDSAGNRYTNNTMNVSVGVLLSTSTDYSNFNEYDSVEVVARGFFNEVKSATVSAVVGDSNTVCPPTRVPIKCVRFLYSPPTP
ncbi:MAG: hypothetical protein AABX95_01985 [Nanoarchaeota archaeon]